jgi:hypothetical protein
VVEPAEARPPFSETPDTMWWQNNPEGNPTVAEGISDVKARGAAPATVNACVANAITNEAISALCARRQEDTRRAAVINCSGY